MTEQERKELERLYAKRRKSVLYAWNMRRWRKQCNQLANVLRNVEWHDCEE